MSRKRRIIDEVSVTTQGICVVNDDIILGEREPGILLVYNRRIAGDGKPEGGGIPGGGSEIFAENPQETLAREFQDETGFPVLECEMLFEDNSKIIQEHGEMEFGAKSGAKIIEIETGLVRDMGVGKEERRLYRDILSRDVEMEWINEMLAESLRNNKIKLPERQRGERRILNRIFVYRVKVAWDGSSLQKILRQRETNCIMLDELDENEIADLNIKEFEEIGGIGIFALEDVVNDFRCKLIYPSHRKRIVKGLQLMNINVTDNSADDIII
jgi:8-oxo-dGTP pyrophosphatase MutT (NUDIX family)